MLTNLFKAIFGRSQLPADAQKLATVELQFDFFITRQMYNYDIRFGEIDSPTKYSAEELKAILVASVFARALTAHSETRQALLEKAFDLSQRLKTGAFSFDDWLIKAGGMNVWIYPWTRIEGLHSGKVATATLMVRSNGQAGLIFDVPMSAPARILFPGFPIHLAKSFCETATEKGRHQLALLLLALVTYFKNTNDFSMSADTLFTTFAYKEGWPVESSQ